MNIEELCNDFEELGDAKERIQYLIELGHGLPALDARHKTEANRVQGCQSNVWLIAYPDEKDPAVMRFEADSDGVISKGIVAVLLAMYSGRTPQEIIEYPLNDVLDRMQLSRFLSPQRSNGLYSMVKRIQALAQHSLAA